LSLQILGQSAAPASVAGKRGFVVKVEGQLKRMLLRLLGPHAEGGTMGMGVNSNEPDLMVNTSAMFSCGEMRGFLGQVISQLRVGYGVKPVRVYAGADQLDRAFGSDEKEGKSFSLSILNVVNTEIWGPSMVPLLDGACEVSGWKVGVKGQWGKF
jgi:triose/dihydroxyacetone kinase / FAD-AMP lyase (cyclizing)